MCVLRIRAPSGRFRRRKGNSHRALIVDLPFPVPSVAQLSAEAADRFDPSLVLGTVRVQAVIEVSRRV